MNRQILIAHATHAELLAHARDTLGMNLPPNTKESTLRSRIGAAWDKEYILAAEVKEEVKQEGSEPQAVTEEQKKPVKEATVKINIHVTEEAGGTEPVQVGVNGRIMLIPRDRDVDIPVSYFEVLDHAVAHKYEMLPDGGMNPVARKVHLYPCQIVA